MDKPQIHRPVMEKFYFTYGTDPKYPFQGGWTLVYATSMAVAQRIFKSIHPNREGSDLLNCAWCYTHEQFMKGNAFKEGNFGVRCHEIICPQLPETGSMETLASRDAILEGLWTEFGEIPMDPDTECMETEFLHFPAGTHREEIWQWFDQRYSKGVGYLLYGDGNDHTMDLATLAYRKTLCAKCDQENCAYHSNGVCCYAMIHGEKPVFDKKHYIYNVCQCFAEKPELCWHLEAQDGV